MKQILLWFLFGVIFWLPLPEGSKPVWAMGLLMLLVFGLSLCWLSGYALGRLSIPSAFLKARWFHFGFIFVTSWLFIQQVPLPVGWVKSLSPQAWEIYTQAYRALELPLPVSIPISIDPFATQISVLLTLSYYLFLCLCLLLISTPNELKTCAWILVFSGMFQAFFGSLSTLSGQEILLFREKSTYFGVATGTFVNRNSFAGCLEMCLAAGMGLMIARIKVHTTQNFTEWLRCTLKTLMSNKILLRIGLVIMVIGLVMSRSRMGNVAFFSSLMLSFFLYVICRKQLSHGMIVFFSSILVIDMAIVSQWFGLDKVAERIGQTSLHQETRPNVSDVTLSAITDYSLTGSGAGSFYTTLPSYHDGSWQGFYDLAHNDLLQFPLEFGLPSYFVLVLMIFAVAWQSVTTMSQRRHRLMVGMGFTSLMGILAIVIHSAVDFNLQIPSNAMYFMLIIAVGILARNMPVTHE